MLRLVLMPIVSGIVATSGITVVLCAIHQTGAVNADMVRAVGSLITGSAKHALRVGMIVQFFNGFIFAALYLHTLSVIGSNDFVSEMFLGGLFGFGQGCFISWAIIRFAYRHPLPEFQSADYQVAIAHIIGHVVFGLSIGAMFGAMRLLGFDVSPGF